jgi:hypothetical protein
VKVFQAIELLAIICATFAGVVLGAFLWKSHGILAAGGGAILGGLGGLFLGLNLLSGVEVLAGFVTAFVADLWRTITRRGK